MLIPDEIRKCVGFICFENVGLPQGTVFFMGDQEPGLDVLWVYAVTAKHMIVGARLTSLDNKIHLRLNSPDGSIRWVVTDVDDWITHPEDDGTIDVAVLPLSIPESSIDYRIYPLAQMASQEVIEQSGIGVGEEVFVTGLFVNHYGIERNIPIVRVGNIAAMPAEPVQTKLGPMDAYLIEARSIGGLSGSPVFVHLGMVRHVQGQTMLAASRYGPFHLLGLMHGHFETKRATQDETGTDGLTDEVINMGIAIVVPASKLREVIDQPRIQVPRKVEAERLRREKFAGLEASGATEVEH